MPQKLKNIRFTHGYSKGAKRRTYGIWAGMIQRCTNPKSVGYANWGGCGIAVCKRWSSFENFLADMGEAPAGLSIDRFPNQNGNYEPGNCRWATAKEQANNSRKNTIISFGDKTLSISQWADLLGISRGVLTSRFQRGWTPDRALTQEIIPRCHPKGAR